MLVELPGRDRQRGAAILIAERFVERQPAIGAIGITPVDQIDVFALFEQIARADIQAAYRRAWAQR